MRHSLVGTLRVDDGGVGIYLKQISRYKPLTSREESETAVRIHRGDAAALERLVKTNLRFVVSVARNYQHQGMSLADLINEGNIGLIKAALRFDEKRNFRFISYAVWWIRQAILQSLANQSRFLRVPVNRVATIHRLGRTRARLEQRYRRTPNVDEMASEMSIPNHDVEHALRVGGSHASLDAPVGESGGSLLESIADCSQAQPDDCIADATRTARIDRLLAVLSNRERRVICLYYGIDEDTNYTLDEIAQQFGITRERVRQIKEAAVRKLRKHQSADEATALQRD